MDIGRKSNEPHSVYQAFNTAIHCPRRVILDNRPQPFDRAASYHAAITMSMSFGVFLVPRLDNGVASARKMIRDDARIWYRLNPTKEQRTGWPDHRQLGPATWAHRTYPNFHAASSALREKVRRPGEWAVSGSFIPIGRIRTVGIESVDEQVPIVVRTVITGGAAKA